MSLHPAAQSRLRAELLTLQPPILPTSAPALPSFPALDASPYLHTVIMETLRLHGAIPGSQPRVSPGSAGAVLADGVPVPVPVGTRVSAQAFSLHRNEAAFPRAEEWWPERWIEGQAEALGLVGREKKERWFWAFGSGGRMCVGSNFAMLGLLIFGSTDFFLAVSELLAKWADMRAAMKLIVATIWSSYESRIVDDTGIEQEDAYTATPKGLRLVLRLEPVNAEKA